MRFIVFDTPLPVPGLAVKQGEGGVDLKISDRAGPLQQEQLAVAAIFGSTVEGVAVLADFHGVVFIGHRPPPGQDRLHEATGEREEAKQGCLQRHLRAF